MAGKAASQANHKKVTAKPSLSKRGEGKPEEVVAQPTIRLAGKPVKTGKLLGR
jgi:hypothetical protein